MEVVCISNTLPFFTYGEVYIVNVIDEYLSIYEVKDDVGNMIYVSASKFSKRVKFRNKKINDILK